jgi:hypothetical protein
MRKVLALAFALLLFHTAAPVQADNFSFSINVGGPPVVIDQPPDFLYPPELGFGVAVGVPYDMFYFTGVYYIFRGGGWYRTSQYGGSWTKVRHRELPPELRRYKIARIHEFRDREYRDYSRDRDHYRGRYFRPARGGGQEHREMRGPGRDEHREMKGPGRDEHREMKGPDRGEHREMKGPGREERHEGGERREH